MGHMRKQSAIIYPMNSRRSGGLSIGVNLFPNRKSCSFDCAYCEVFPFSGGTAFSLDKMERHLRRVLDAAQEQNERVMDIRISGSGEPTDSVDLPDALDLATRIRGEMVPAAQLVLVTNGTGLLRPWQFALLRNAATGASKLDIWLKLDAGTQGWFRRLNKPAVNHRELIEKIKEFTACAPVTIQAMFCAVDGIEPAIEETQIWERLVTEMVAANKAGGSIRKVQICGKARPSSQDPRATPLPVEYLEKRATSLYLALSAQSGRRLSKVPMVEVYP